VLEQIPEAGKGSSAKGDVQDTLLSLNELEERAARLVARGDAQATESMYGDLNEELGRMNAEIGAFEETLKSFHEIRVTT
jgi:hypothetical protein